MNETSNYRDNMVGNVNPFSELYSKGYEPWGQFPIDRLDDLDSIDFPEGAIPMIGGHCRGRYVPDVLTIFYKPSESSEVEK